MGYLDAGNQGGLLGPLPDNRLLGAADYAGVQPGYAPDGQTNAGPLYDAYRTFVDGAKAMPGQYLQQHQDFLDGIDPNTGQPADTFASRMNTLGHYLATNAGPQSLGGAMAPVEGAFGAGPIRAFHGSPHSFNRFDLSKIGTGEGAQAYGRGLYFAQNEDVARGYRDALSKYNPQVGGVPVIDSFMDGSLPGRVSELTGLARPDSIEAANLLAESTRTGRPLADVISDRAARGAELFGPDEAARLTELGKQLAPIAPQTSKGSMYEVNLHADPASLLDWHKPLGQQSQQIQDVVAQLGAQHGFTVGPQGPGYLAYQRLRDAGVIDTSTATDAARASQSLLEAGVPGIQYRDGLSRTIGTGTLDKQKTSNYVMFDPARIEILRRYGLLGPAAVGGGLLGGEQQ